MEHGHVQYAPSSLLPLHILFVCSISMLQAKKEMLNKFPITPPLLSASPSLSVVCTIIAYYYHYYYYYSNCRLNRKLTYFW